MNSLQVLVIEDDFQTRRLLKRSLSLLGWQIVEAENGEIGLRIARNIHPQITILDLGLPDISGIEILKLIRQFSDMPVLILSARSQEANKIEALDAGADDYLTKPFSSGELNARLQALNRRILKRGTLNDVFTLGDLSVNLENRKITVAGQHVHLTPIEYRLLNLLIRHAGLVMTHRQLLTEVWGIEHVHDSHYLRIYMGQLRHKLESDPARPKYIMTEVGIGYRLAIDEH